MTQRVTETRNLYKRFGAVTALDNVDLVVERDEFQAGGVRFPAPARRR